MMMHRGGERKEGEDEGFMKKIGQTGCDLGVSGEQVHKMKGG